MSETRGLYQMLMLAFLFNIIMYGVFEFTSSNPTYNTDISCGINGDPITGLINVSDIEYSDDVAQGIDHCSPSPEIAPWWFFALWAIIDGVVIYAFIPFVK